MGVVGDATVIRLRLSSDDVVDELHYNTVSGWVVKGFGPEGPGSTSVFLSGDEYQISTPIGSYKFENVLDGSYTVTPVKAGSTFYPDHQDIVVSGADVVVDTMYEVWVVSGYIVDEFDAGIEGVTVALTGDKSDSTTTDAHGFYSFSNIVNGSYTVTPTKSGLEFTPDHEDVVVDDADEVVDDIEGGAIKWTISGYILDGDSDGIENVTVTLSGDDNDSDTTDAHGYYEFSMPDGDYTLTPTLAHYSFTADHEDITVAGDDVVVDTMVSALSAWTVSGYILDGDSAGIEDVTITLTGDDSDSTTTDADGYYEFTFLPAGDYAITPTLSGYVFTADHEDVTVSGAAVVVDTMVGENIYIALPYTYNMSDVAPSSGGVAAQLADWDVWTTLADGTITTSIADLNSYSPSGVTKAFSVPWGASRSGIVNNIGLVVDPSLTSIRIAALFRCAQANRYPQFFVRDSLATPLSMFSVFASGNASPDLAYTTARYEDAFNINEIGGSSVGGDYETRWWHWLRGEWNFVTEEVIMSLYRVETASTIWTKTVSMNAAGVTLGHVPSGMDRLAILATEANTTAILAKYWIGTASDAWPT